MQFSSIWPTERALLGADYEGILRILQSSSIAIWFSVISRTLIGGVLPLRRAAVGVLYSPTDWAIYS